MGWEQKKLGEVCSLINRGVAPKYIDAGGVAVLNQKCIRDHEISFELGRRHDVNEKRVDPERYIRAGDVLVNSTGTGTLGRVAQVRAKLPEPTTVDTHVTIVRPESDRFYLHFFGYMLIQIEDDITKSGEGASGQTELSRAVLQNKTVSFPASISEQQRIVAILDEAFSGLETAIANIEKNLASTRELFDSYLDAVFMEMDGGWTGRKLGDICERVSVGHVGPTSQFYCDESEGVPFLRSQNVRPGNLNFAGIRHITREFHKRLKKSQLMAGDLLFVRVGANRGDCCSVPSDLGQLNCANIVFARPREAVTRFLEAYCRSTLGRQQLLSMTTGSAQGVINTGSVAELVIPLPSEAQQHEILRTLDNIAVETDRLETCYSLKLKSLTELKKSLLQKAFSGELTSPPTIALREAAE
jgi:type I restriction enzyme, S subunit